MLSSHVATLPAKTIFAMALDEAHHRLFVQCRVPASLLVLATETGKVVESLQGANSDHIFYDGNKARIYVLGQTVKGAEPREACGLLPSGFVGDFDRLKAVVLGRQASLPAPLQRTCRPWIETIRVKSLLGG